MPSQGNKRRRRRTRGWDGDEGKDEEREKDMINLICPYLLLTGLRNYILSLWEVSHVPVDIYDDFCGRYSAVMVTLKDIELNTMVWEIQTFLMGLFYVLLAPLIITASLKSVVSGASLLFITGFHHFLLSWNSISVFTSFFLPVFSSPCNFKALFPEVIVNKHGSMIYYVWSDSARFRCN